VKQSDERKTPVFRRVVEGPVSRFSGWVTVVSATAGFIIMVLVSVDVLMRRLLSKPITGSFEICTSLLVVLVSCSIAWVMTEKGHIIVNIITSKYPQRLREVTRSIGLFLGLIVVGLICWASLLYGLQEFRIGDKSNLLGIPLAPFVFVLSFGSALLGLVILVQFINTFTKSRGG